MNAQNQTRLLLHACCGPCSLEPTRLLAEEGYNLTLYYANSNISPSTEYKQRLTTIAAWANDENLSLVEGDYNPDAWETRVGCISDPAKRAARCRACYRMRFEESARYAAEHGYDAICTTLSVSPYQYIDSIHAELERAAHKAGVKAEFRDFRPFYQQATQRARDIGMYRQNYCGCRFSIAEAQEQRAKRKREREHKKAREAQAHAAERAAAKAQRATRKAERAAYDAKRRKQREILRAFRTQQSKQDNTQAAHTENVSG